MHADWLDGNTTAGNVTHEESDWAVDTSDQNSQWGLQGVKIGNSAKMVAEWPTEQFQHDSKRLFEEDIDRE